MWLHLTPLSIAFGFAKNPDQIDRFLCKETATYYEGRGHFSFGWGSDPRSKIIDSEHLPLTGQSGREVHDLRCLVMVEETL